MKSKILIVEDEIILAMGLKRKLIKMDYEVVGIAFSGDEAINLARSKKPHLILMDIVLKGDMDGIEAAGKIMKFCNIPIIYLTAYADDDILERAMVTEPYGYIIKPYKDNELKANIKMALYKHRIEKENKKSIKKQLTDAYYQFILSSVNESAKTDDQMNVLFDIIQKNFEDKMKPQFYNELQNKGLDIMEDDEDNLFYAYVSWLSGLFLELGIKNKLIYDKEKYYFEFFNCAWVPNSVKNPLYCINCLAMISTSFSWIHMEGRVKKMHTIAGGYKQCRFIIY